MKLNSCFKLLLVSVVAFCFTAQAQSQFSRTQIEQFKQLPKEQQRALARQYGVDLEAITGSARSKATNAVQNEQSEISNQQQQVQQALEHANKQKSAEESEEEFPALKPFGYNLFDGAASGFTNLDNLPVPADYLVGPKDTVFVQLYGKESRDYELEVHNDGYIIFPDYGPLNVSGLTFIELKSAINKFIQAKSIGLSTNVRISQLKSMQVFVLGEAFKPGSYTLSSLASITHALFASGGVSNNGTLRKIQLKRKGRLVTEFDVYDLLLSGDTSNDIRLVPGDVVFIPTVNKQISISGQVNRPAIYELTETESFSDLLRMAGGLKANAYPQAATVSRFNDKNLLTTLNVNFSQDSELQQRTQNGDTVNIPTASSIVTNSITIKGSVVHPGKYQWKPNLRLSNFISNIEADMLESADLNYGLVIRQEGNSRRISVLQFSPVSVIHSPKSNDDIVLERNDEVLVFSREHNKRKELLSPIIVRLKEQVERGELAPIIKVAGEVEYPGDYPLVKQNSAADIISAAGGVHESAYMEYAELVRTAITPNGPVDEYLTLDLRRVLGDGSKQVFLQPKDQLVIRKKPGWNEDRTIELLGEVRFPGTYSFNAGETISSVIERAGGFTDYAFVEGSIFTREKERKKQQQHIERLAKDMQKALAVQSLGNSHNLSSAGNFTEKLEVIDTIRGLESPGRIVIDINGIVSKQENADFSLEAGDKLYVPTKNNAVAVVGMVQFEATHFFNESLTMDDYLALSGGLKKQADIERVYVIKADGSVKMPQDDNWFTASEVNTIEPGDTVVVPMEVGYLDNLGLWTSITQILYQTGVAIAAIGSL